MARKDNSFVRRRRYWWISRGLDVRMAEIQAEHEFLLAIVRARKSGASCKEIALSLGVTPAYVSGAETRGLQRASASDFWFSAVENYFAGGW